MKKGEKRTKKKIWKSPRIIKSVKKGYLAGCTGTDELCIPPGVLKTS